MIGAVVRLAAVLGLGCALGDNPWGTYRPGVYVGVKARAPMSPVLGLMYHDARSPDCFNRAGCSFRCVCARPVLSAARAKISGTTAMTATR